MKSPIPNTQYPIPNPQSPISNIKVPIIGTIGTGKIERLFCTRAHTICQRQWATPSDCPQFARVGQDGLCGLTGHRHLCLFLDPDPTPWDHIRRSVALEKSLPFPLPSTGLIGTNPNLQYPISNIQSLINAHRRGNVTDREFHHEMTFLLHLSPPGQNGSGKNGTLWELRQTIRAWLDGHGSLTGLLAAWWQIATRRVSIEAEDTP